MDYEALTIESQIQIVRSRLADLEAQHLDNELLKKIAYGNDDESLDDRARGIIEDVTEKQRKIDIGRAILRAILSDLYKELRAAQE